MSQNRLQHKISLIFVVSAFILQSLALPYGFAQEGGTSHGDSLGPRVENELTGTYIVAFSTAGTHDFISNVSFAGLGLEWGHYVTQNLSLGLSTRWNRFYQEDDRQTYQVQNAAITGKQYKALNVYPIFPKAKFDFDMGHETPLVPFIQIGLGPIYGQKYRTVGNYTFNDFGWQFGFAPEVGVIWRSAYKPLGALFSVRYDVGLGTDAIPAYSAFNLTLGIRSAI
jgi:hypothetical protein